MMPATLTSYTTRVIPFSGGKAIGLFLLLCSGGILIYEATTVAVFNTLIVFFVISIMGAFLCQRTQHQIGDSGLSVLTSFWFVKLVVTLIVLYFGWMPQLDYGTSFAWGYDPQRYYLQAQELVDNNFVPEFVNLNYAGILYYYGVIFYLFGHNPIIPALINAFITLVAVLYLVRVGYEFKGERQSGDWKIAFALLLPELLWYDALTSRETLLGALLLVILLTVGRYLVRTTNISLLKVLSVVLSAAFAVAAVRTSMLVPVVGALLLMIVFVIPVRGFRVVQEIVLVLVAVAAIYFGPILTEYLGGYEFGFGKSLRYAVSSPDNFALANSAISWSENSIGMLLIPDGVIQAIVFLPLRMLLYLVSPIPNIFVSIGDLSAGNWSAWQKLFTAISSCLNLFIFPYVLASLIHSVQIRKINAAPLMSHAAYWVVFAAIAGGNVIIHERYRVMTTLLLWLCAWLGARTAPKNIFRRMAVAWYTILAVGAFFYIGYKDILA